MFGYIRPCKPQLKVCEFDTFKAIYCGLCKELSHTFGPFSSLTLSYDFTFAATVSLALSDQCSGFKKCSCVANPLKKKACLLPCADLNYSASAAMLMIYYKLKDDIADSSFLKRLGYYFLLPFAASARKKARKKYPEVDRIIADAMAEQAALERNGEQNPDRAADPTAKALAGIFEQFSDNQTQKLVLNRFGYLLGRYVYFADALDDLAENEKSGSYNPFLKKWEGSGKALADIREYATQALNLTIGEIPAAYELLTLKQFKPILDNVVYLGLPQEVNFILNRPKKERKNSKDFSRT